MLHKRDYILKYTVLALVAWVHFYTFKAQAQAYLAPNAIGNEWIDLDQSYYALEVSEEGIYRINYDVLISMGIPADQIHGRQFELFALGERVRLRPSSEDVFASGDYLEFYGQGEDGSLDALLYSNANQEQLNPSVSLYSKSRTYYLTWSDTPSDNLYEFKDNGLNNSGRPIQEAYYMHRETIIFDEYHNKPTRDGRNFIRYSSMDIGEGYGAKLQHEKRVTLPISNRSSFGVDPKLKLRFATNDWSRQWNVFIDNKLLKSVVAGGLSVVDIDEKFPLEDIGDRETTIRIASNNNEQEKHSIASVELRYPREYEFDGSSYVSYYQHPSILDRYIEYNGFVGNKPVLYNLDENYFLFPEREGDIVKTNIPVAYSEQHWVLVDQDQGIKPITSLKEISFNAPTSIGNYLILSHKNLINSGAVEAYANYRRSTLGGGYDVSIQDIETLYNQFGYGIEGHPLSIQNFMKHLKAHNETPEYVFIIGKGYEYPAEIDESIGQVPTFGFPGSDNLLLAQEGYRYPAVPVGRLAARTPEDVLSYLEKIKTQEMPSEAEQDIENQAWKKKIIHLSGGSADNQEVLYGFLNDMGEVISNNTFGADVFTFRKTSADPLQIVQQEDIISQIDGGAAIMTFFGHSAVGSFDLNLEDPSRYSNNGRNPIILSLGCHSGNIHTTTRGISEEFVLEPERGAIAFIASAGTAYPEPQYFTGLNFYDLIGEEMYGMTIGSILQSSLKNRDGSNLVSEQTLIEQLTLHGDPAFRYGSFEGPDYIVDESAVQIQPGLISANTDLISIGFDVVNLGALVNEPLDIDIIHVLPDGITTDTITMSIPAPGNRTSITIDIDNPGLNGVGENQIYIVLDPDQRIAEAPNEKAEQNNSLKNIDGKEGVSFFILDQNAKPSFPSNFGIVGDPNLSLTATINNGFSGGGVFIMEVDTTETFDSPFLMSAEITSSNSLIQWRAPIDWQEEKVYYWRVASKESNPTLKSNKWKNSSFVFLSNHLPGWNQSHYFQKNKNDFTTIHLDTLSRQLEYDDRIWDVRIKNEMKESFDFWVFVNNTAWASLNPKNLAPAISIFIWEEQNVLFQNSGTDFGSLPFSRDIFIYKMDTPENRKNIKDLLDAIPNGSRAFVHTILNDENSDLHIDEWAADTTSLGFSFFDVLESYGATKVRDLIDRGTVPYTFVFDKGGDPIIEDIANNIFETIDLSSKARTIWNRGAVNSTIVGPASRWSEIVWSETINGADATSLSIYGITSAGKKEKIRTVSDQYSIDISDIDASVYSSLQLEYFTEDLENKTSANLNYWRVVFDQLPDAAINNTLANMDIQDTIDSGVPILLDFQVENLSQTTLVPIKINYTLIDENGRSAVHNSKTDRSIPGQELLYINDQISTDGLSGLYQLIVEVNPNGDVAEHTDCNNIGYRQIYIRPDHRNPFLTVTFDGRRISDGELILPQPQIIVSLQDIGAATLLDDPTDFDITLFYPQFLRWKVDSSSIAAQFIPASDINDNIAQFILTPNLNVDGIYTLEVQAKDKAGNASGNQKYRVRFEIDHDADVIILSVHPNPSSNYIDFDYYLEGENVPDIFDLYIYTSAGVLVEHATKEDWGGIRPGFNSYRWQVNQSDALRVPTGIYYYQIINSFDSKRDKKKGSVFIHRE